MHKGDSLSHRKIVVGSVAVAEVVAVGMIVFGYEELRLFGLGVVLAVGAALVYTGWVGVAAVHEQRAQTAADLAKMLKASAEQASRAEAQMSRSEAQASRIEALIERVVAAETTVIELIAAQAERDQQQYPPAMPTYLHSVRRGRG
jgi:hypothetical protein